MKHDRPLSEGYVGKSINKRMRTGIAETRPGTRVPADFNPGYNPVKTLVGAGTFNSNAWGELTMIAEESRNYVWACRDGATAIHVPLLDSSTFGGFSTVRAWFCQAFSECLLLRGGLSPLHYNGLNPSPGFDVVFKLDPLDTSTNLIPNAGYGIPFNDRILLQWGKDGIVITDVLDYTSYDNVYGLIRINAAAGESIVSIHPYNNDSVLVFMTRSIHRLYNFTADLSLARQEVVTDEIGGIGREGAVQVGADIIFLSRNGFYRVNQVFENQTVAAPIPISDKIAPLIEGINWEQINLIGFASLAFLGDYVYCAVGIGRDYPRNLLVYNTITSEWESVDAWDDATVHMNFLRLAIVDGERRLLGVKMTAPPRIYLTEEGITDMTGTGTDGSGTTNGVNDILETRGYAGNTDPNSQKRFRNVAVTVRTRNPSFKISALFDGYFEEKMLTPSPVTKDLNKFYVWGHPDFTGSPFDEQKRQDYYTGTEADWPATEMANAIALGGSIDLPPGVNALMAGGPKTQSTETRQIRRMGRWCSIRIQNTQGACDIVGVAVEYQGARRDSLTHA